MQPLKIYLHQAANPAGRAAELARAEILDGSLEQIIYSRSKTQGEASLSGASVSY